jgi:4-hydroxy-tetrahydrodipicolinate synthase
MVMQGVFPILATPFDNHDHIDEESLRREVDFTIDAGVHGLGIALGSELLKLNEAERTLVISIVVHQTRGRVPIVVNTGAQSNVVAAEYSRQAQELGASAVMCMPPAAVSAMETRSYFKSISDAVDVPVFIQDTLAAPVSAGLIRQIAEESEHVRYAKVESPPQPIQVQAAVDAAVSLVTVFGGSGGIFLPQELRRGSQGTMPWPSQPRTFVRIWDLWQAGREAEAIDIHEREIVPLGRLCMAGLRVGHTVHKEVLRRAGVLESSRVRAPADPLDAITLRELDAICERLGIGTAVV